LPTLEKFRGVTQWVPVASIQRGIVISLAMISKQLMVSIPGLVIQGIMTRMPPLDLAVHIMGGMKMMTMITIMIAVIVV
jgi:hypothetical protein